MKISQQLTLVFKNRPSEICERQPLKTAQSLNSIFLKAVFHNFYLVHS